MWDVYLYNACWDCKTEMMRMYGQTQPDHPLLKELAKFMDEMDKEPECEGVTSCSRFVEGEV